MFRQARPDPARPRVGANRSSNSPPAIFMTTTGGGLNQKTRRHIFPTWERWRWFTHLYSMRLVETDTLLSVIGLAQAPRQIFSSPASFFIVRRRFILCGFTGWFLSRGRLSKIIKLLLFCALIRLLGLREESGEIFTPPLIKLRYL